MLRVGLTGGLGSGKSAVGAMLADLGARVLEADEIGRDLMRPGEVVFARIAERFGPGVVRPDGLLDRPELARLAFAEGRVEELNEIVHPAVIARQAELTAEIGRQDREAVVVVESALIFETRYAGADGWRKRFDRLLLVRAPPALMMERYLQRLQIGRAELTAEAREAAMADAQRRMALQMPEAEKAAVCDYVLWNAGGLAELRRLVEALWPVLQEGARVRL